MRTAIPRPFLAYYPALIAQADLDERINLLNDDNTITSIETGHPPAYAPLQPRENYDPPISPKSPEYKTLFDGLTKRVKLGDVVLARSGDKGGNLNVGFFVPSSLPPSFTMEIDTQRKQRERQKDLNLWLRHYLTTSRMRDLLGTDWRDEYFIERVEFPAIGAVHFVIYGILGRGVSSSSRLDGLGKGVADWLRDVVVEVPVALLE
jgi:hypothetical protein